MDILRERPDNMSFDDYKNYLKRQKKYIKAVKKGHFCYISSEVAYMPGDTDKVFSYIKRYPPFKGVAKDLNVL